MDQQEFDVIIVGAGASGLQAALEIALTGKRTAILEAKNRTGGRIYTIDQNGLPIELGAEFVHGNLPLTQHWLEKAGIEKSPVNGSIWQYKEGQLQQQEDFIEDYEALEKKFGEVKSDKSVDQFLQQHLSDATFSDLRFSLHNYVEGYYAADIANASALALCRELTEGDEEQYRLHQGYDRLVDQLEQQCRQTGVSIFLSQAVHQVQWKKGEVAAITETGTYKAQKLLITVPIGVLQNEAITFFPALPQVIKEAVQKLGFGHVVKLVYHFDEPFWKNMANTSGKDLADLSFVFSEEEIPTWWTRYPANEPVLTGWLGGPKAKAAQFFSTEVMVEKGLASLCNIFHLEPGFLRQHLQQAFHHNWSADEHVYGAYSYEVVGGEEAIQTLLQPVEETLFFAGEGLRTGPQIGTVEGALVSGREAAQRLVTSFST